MNLLSEDVVLWTDAGGKTITAAYRPNNGKDAVAWFSLGTKRFWSPDYHPEMAEVNGQQAMILYAGEKVFAVLTVETDADHIQTILVMANSEKLARL